MVAGRLLHCGGMWVDAMTGLSSVGRRFQVAIILICNPAPRGSASDDA
jgi:hypothetical protein